MAENPPPKDGADWIASQQHQLQFYKAQPERFIATGLISFAVLSEPKFPHCSRDERWFATQTISRQISECRLYHSVV